MIASFLTPEVLEESHTAKDYLLWARSLVERVKLEHDGLKRIRFRDGLAKELMDEAIPIGLLGSKYFEESNEVQINLKIGSQSFDAIVSDNRAEGSSVSHIEVTLAHEGENQHLRMLCLHERGEVSGLGAVTKQGTKKTNLTVDVVEEMVSQVEVLQRERTLVSMAIDRKLKKTYPPNTLLLIGFDDTMAFDREDNVANLENVLVKYLPQLKAFHTVAIVGLQQSLFLSKRTGDAI